MNQDYNRGYMEGYLAALIRQDFQSLTLMDQLTLDGIATPNLPKMDEKKTKRRKSAYQRRYQAAFRKIAPKYKLKSGKWKAGGFKKAVKAAHKEAKK